MRTAGRIRVRPLLLVLLWIWAGCVALVLDLFLNVEELDAVRPRAPLYRAMRQVAHEMVGEPILDEDVSTARTPLARPARMAARTGAPHEPRPDPAVPSSRHPGGRPDARTPSGLKLFQGLLAAARREEDPARCAAALRSLAGMFGPQASSALYGIGEDPAQPREVRALSMELHRRGLERSK